MELIFSQINYWAVLVSGIVFWFIGMLWFSLIVGKRWSVAMSKHGIKLGKPNTNVMITKSIWTFILNLLAAFGIAIIISAIGVHTFAGGLGVGFVLGLLIAAVPMATSYVWEGRSLELSFYDIFYPFIGIIISAIIIALWS